MIRWGRAPRFVAAASEFCAHLRSRTISPSIDLNVASCITSTTTSENVRSNTAEISQMNGWLIDWSLRDKNYDMNFREAPDLTYLAESRDALTHRKVVKQPGENFCNSRWAAGSWKATWQSQRPRNPSREILQGFTKSVTSLPHFRHFRHFRRLLILGLSRVCWVSQCTYSLSYIDSYGILHHEVFNLFNRPTSLNVSQVLRCS